MPHQKVGEKLVAAPKMQSITIRLPIEDYGWLQRQAEKTDQSVSYLIRRAIRMYIVASNKKKSIKVESKSQGADQ